MAPSKVSASKERPKELRVIVFLQYMLPVSFTVAMAGILTWIVSLIVLSRELHDVPSASIGISIVAIPVFLILLSVFWYVFLGIIGNQEEEPAGLLGGETAEQREGVEQ